MGRPYPEALRAEVIAYASEHGVTSSAVKYGVGKATVSSWCKAAGVGTVRNAQTAAATEAAALHWEERRAGMVHRMGATAELALAAVDTALRSKDARTAKDSALTMAILVDKAQLLSGGSTSRAEMRDTREEVIASARARALTLVPGGAG